MFARTADAGLHRSSLDRECNYWYGEWPRQVKDRYEHEPGAVCAGRGVLERHGFSTTLIERPFDGAFRRREADDPAVLVCGVDNVLARSQIEDPGFPMVVEAGIGDSAQDLRSLRVHTFPVPH